MTAKNAADTPRDPRRVFDHVLVIMFENQYRSYVMQNKYMQRLASHGIELANYFGVMHPSQTNYIASIAGSLCNVTSDNQPSPLLAEGTVVDLLEAAGLSWKAYMESYVAAAQPWSPTLLPKNAPPYYVKHNPFSSFASIVRNKARWSRVQDEAALFADLLNGELPAYAWFTPNIWSDGHWMDGTARESVPRAPFLVDQLARWLEGFFGRLRFPGPRSHLPPRTLVVVTFDEADFETDYLPAQASEYDGPNQIYTVLLGDVIRPGVEVEGYNHYSLIRTIEQNFSLGTLGRNDLGANWFQFLWGRRFTWGPSVTLPWTCSGPVAAEGLGGALVVASSDGAGSVVVRRLSRGRWSTPESLNVDGSVGLAMAATASALVLVALGADGTLVALTCSHEGAWSASATLGNAEALALCAFDEQRQIMLVYRSTGAVSARVWASGAFGAPTPVPAAATSGALAVGCLGASVYLIVQGADAGKMNVVSYNSADYNVVIVPNNKYGGVQDNTTVNMWSPCVFPVTGFSSWPGKGGEAEPHSRPHSGAGPFALASLHGVLHFVHAAMDGRSVVTETFSIAGVMTPARQVSYRSADADADDFSNGYGTLAQAGWSPQRDLEGGGLAAGGVLAMARAGEQLYLLQRADASAPICLRIGAYGASD